MGNEQPQPQISWSLVSFHHSCIPTRVAFNHSTEFADVLEQLETEFYTQALAKFQASDFTAAGFASSQVAIEQFSTIQGDESTHSTVLQVCKLYAFFFSKLL